MASSNQEQWPVREIAGRIEDSVWPLLKLFTNDEYAKRYTREGVTLSDEHHKRIANGIIQSREYFQAASHTSVATAPVLLYYGMLHLADVLIASRGNPQPSHHGLTRSQVVSSDLHDYFACRIGRTGTFASLNEVIDCDVSPVRNPLGKDGVVLWSTVVGTVQEHPSRENILGSGVHFWDLVGSIPDLNEHCRYSDKIGCLTAPLHETRVEARSPDEIIVTVAFERDLEEYVEGYLVSGLGMERWVEGIDLVGYRLVSKDEYKIPKLRAPLRGQPNILGDPSNLPSDREWQISELATMFLSMFILGDLARYKSEIWMNFINRPSAELEAVSAFVDVALPKFPYLVLNHLRGEYLHFTY